MISDRIVKFLVRQGYLLAGGSAVEALAALTTWREQLGLEDDKAIVDRYVDMPRFCSVPDSIGSGARCRWDGTKRPLPITWTIVGSIAGISDETLKKIYTEAWRRWSAVCGIVPEYVGPGRGAMVVMTHGKIDGESSTLAWSELPCGPDQPLDQKYDTGEKWFSGFGDPTGGRISLVAVATHEIGHVIGLDHLGEGNLLAPYYSPKIREPQPGDIAEAVARYGLPAAPTPNPDPPTTPNPSGTPWDATVTLAKPDGTPVVFEGTLYQRGS